MGWGLGYASAKRKQYTHCILSGLCDTLAMHVDASILSVIAATLVVTVTKESAAQSVRLPPIRVTTTPTRPAPAEPTESRLGVVVGEVFAGFAGVAGGGIAGIYAAPRPTPPLGFSNAYGQYAGAVIGASLGCALAVATVDGIAGFRSRAWPAFASSIFVGGLLMLSGLHALEGSTVSVAAIVPGLILGPGLLVGASVAATELFVAYRARAAMRAGPTQVLHATARQVRSTARVQMPAIVRGSNGDLMVTVAGQF